jgi:hypothetical protein
MGRLAEKLAEAGGVKPVLRNHLGAEKDNGDVVGEAVMEDGVFVDIDFAKSGVEGLQERLDGGFCFLAEMAAFARVKRNFARAGDGQAAVFGAAIEVAAGGGKQSGLGERGNGIENGLAVRGRVAAGDFENGMQVERIALELVKGGKRFSGNGVERQIGLAWQEGCYGLRL